MQLPVAFVIDRAVAEATGAALRASDGGAHEAPVRDALRQAWRERQARRQAVVEVLSDEARADLAAALPEEAAAIGRLPAHVRAAARRDATSAARLLQRLHQLRAPAPVVEATQQVGGRWR